MRYLKGTLNFGLLYTSNGSKGCIGYSDADWAGDLDDRKSTSGYVFQIGGGAVSWKSKKQSCVASTAEAEYMALASAAQEAIWIAGSWLYLYTVSSSHAHSCYMYALMS